MMVGMKAVTRVEYWVVLKVSSMAYEKVVKMVA